MASISSQSTHSSLAELAIIFLRLGLTAFGGPAAHIAMMRTEFVEKRHWLTDSEFLDLVGASNMIPGPGSTEVAIYIGARRCGWMGLVLAGLCFILPAALLVSAIAYGYVRYGHLPHVQAAFYGVKPVIAAVVASAAWALGRTAWRASDARATGVLGVALSFLSINNLIILFGGGFAVVTHRVLRREVAVSPTHFGALAGVALALIGVPLALAGVGTLAAGPSPPALFATFLKIGSVLYGNGYVLLSFLQTNLVERLHWLTLSQVVDAVAVGQFTPGPVFTTATFIGFILAGPAGAFAATVGIFLPAFLLVAVSGPLIPKLRSEPVAAAFLDGVNAASVALLVCVSWSLARAAIIDLPTTLLAGIAIILIIRYHINSAWIMLLGALYGWVAFPMGRF
ncbi:MAG TPA: chromate efflux transporter [Capsulimonadaceae bacterium]|jgi:chromate transporter